MIRLYIIILFLTASLCSSAQRDNPFEIDRQGQTQEIDVSQISAAEFSEDTIPQEDIKVSDNPFDVSYTRPQAEAIPAVKAKKTSVIRQINQGPSKGLVLIFTIIILVLLSVAIAFNRVRFTVILGSLVNGNNLKTLHRGNKPWTDVQTLLLYGIFFLNGAFFLWLLGARLFQGQLPGFLYLLLGLMGLYLVRHLSMLIVSDIYSLGTTVEQFNYSIALHNVVIGVVLLPFILSLGYVADQNVRTLAAGLTVILGIIYLLRQSKGILSAVGIRGFNPFYFFIYLCAFEITPILMACKVIGGAL